MSFSQLIVFLGFYYLFLIFDVGVGVLDIYEQTTVKGAKKRQYGGVTGTRLSHIKV
jgi:hypothetical protein